MLIAHKIALNPNNKQKTYFAKASGVARFAYNWALTRWQEQYNLHKEDKNNPSPTNFSLRRELNAIKREQFPWMLEVTKNAPQMAIIQLGTAFKNFFNKQASYPKKRKKGKDDRFSLTNDQFKVIDLHIRIPNLGLVRMRERLHFKGKIISATISRTADKWYASITVETNDYPHLPNTKNQGVVGVDLGVSSLATLSTGEVIVGKKAHTALLKKVKRASKSLSRKIKGSKNRNKAKLKLAKLHAKISNIRKDELHKFSTYLTSNFHTIGIEDLNIKGMMKNRCLSRSIADMGFFEFSRQLDYKASMKGNIIKVADRWFASSKLCSNCGYKNEELTLAIRQWLCPACNIKHDRDLNAAINLKKYAMSSMVSVCGEEGSGKNQQKIFVKPASMKQKVNTKTTCE